MENELSVFTSSLQSKYEEAAEILKDANEILIPQRTFSCSQDYGSVDPYIHYISDMHLDAHILNNGVCEFSSIKKYFDKICSTLVSEAIFHAFSFSEYGNIHSLKDLINMEYYPPIRHYFHGLSIKSINKKIDELDKSELNAPILPFFYGCILFNGDLSGSIKLNELFFERFFMRLKYFIYKDWKREYLHSDCFRYRNLKNKQDFDEFYNAQLKKFKCKRDSYIANIKLIPCIICEWIMNLGNYVNHSRFKSGACSCSI